MARIVPAKPKFIDNNVLNFFLELEKSFNDDYLIFQNFPIFNSFLVASEGYDSAVVIIVSDGEYIDFDGMTIQRQNNPDLDIDILVSEIHSSLSESKIDIRPKIIFFTPELKNQSVTEVRSSVLNTDISFLTKLFNPINFIEMKIKDVSHPVNGAVLDGLINYLSPGSSPYEKGKITEAQMRWREQSHGVKEHSNQENILDGFTGKISSHATNKKDELELEDSIEIPRTPVREVIPDSPKAPIRVEYLEKMIHNILYNLSKNRPIYTSGVEIDPVFVSGKDCLLPAVIVAASEMWTPLVVKKSGKGGFDVRLKTDPQSLLGFSVVDVIPSAPMVLFMPITHLFRTMINDGEFILDDIVSVFARWVIKHNLENTHLEEIDLKIALKAIEGS